MFGPERIVVTGGCKKLHSDEHSLPRIIRIIKSRRLGWAGNVAQTVR
jgi:hypothetical protein